MDYDIVIVGGGVIGLACAMRLSEKNLNLLLIERHKSFGNETSSRNSEVIHAGIYYPKDSLKAKLCTAGNISLYEWCLSKNVGHSRIGKYIIAVNPEEEKELDKIYKQAVDNGVEGIGRISAGELNEAEPYIRASAALYSRDTGIINSHELMDSFLEQAKSNDCDFAWKHTLQSVEPLNEGYLLKIEGPDSEMFSLTCKYLINAAGLDSDTVAEMAGIDIDSAGYRLHYCRGHYFRIRSSKKYLAKHLIYPVPMKNLAGLGIHVTVDMAGEIRLGPDVRYLNNRVQDYSVPEGLQEKFYEAASAYLTGLEPGDIYPDQSGIRPKLQPPGGSFRDFIIREESYARLPGLINLIGIESPGLTCCLEIAKIVETFII